MKTYTDADVRAALKTLVEQSTYARAEAFTGINRGYLHSVVHGTAPVTVNVARAVGFVPVERAWRKA